MADTEGFRPLDAGRAVELSGAITDQVRDVVREQIELALRETFGRIPRLGASAKLRVAAGVLALYAGGTLIAAIVLLLALVIPAWASALIIAAVLAAAAAVLRAKAKSHTGHEVSPLPEQAPKAPDLPR
ncbi:phage holin family protein [Nocardia sp. NPDC050406]|uniref:phage holin family protein n=1 Tax=Nocardia sp. NPDC050406 TaxID=3364318 RepID=UPI0037979DBE